MGSKLQREGQGEVGPQVIHSPGVCRLDSGGAWGRGTQHRDSMGVGTVGKGQLQTWV